MAETLTLRGELVGEWSGWTVGLPHRSLQPMPLNWCTRTIERRVLVLPAAHRCPGCCISAACRPQGMGETMQQQEAGAARPHAHTAGVIACLRSGLAPALAAVVAVQTDGSRGGF